MGLIKCQFAIYLAEMEHPNHSKNGRLASIDEEDTFIEQTRDGHEGGSLEVSQQLGGMHGESAFDVYVPKVQRELVFTSVTEHYEAIHTQT